MSESHRSVKWFIPCVGKMATVDSWQYSVRRKMGTACTICPTEMELSAFQMGDLSERRLEEVADHLESCSRCEALAQHLDTRVDPILAALRLSPRVSTATIDRLGDQSSWRAEFTPRTLVGASSFPFLEPAQEPGELGRLAHYRVLRLLGRGGMGFVFEAEDIRLGRRVALKTLNPFFGVDKSGWRRFAQEARIMAAIKDESLVAIYQAGEAHGVAYLAMELLEGETLAEWMSRTDRTNVSEMLRLCEQITRGLAAVHRHGLAHRDLKPTNLWVEPSGRIRVLDFGLARFIQDGGNLTATGTVLGTPAFMSPEQTRGEPCDARSDLFSLGAVLYCLLTGNEPFQASNAIAILTALTFRTPKEVGALNPLVPAALSDLVMDLLEKEPSARPQTTEEVLARLALIRMGDEIGAIGRGSQRLRHAFRFGSKKGGRRVAIALTVSLALCIGWSLRGSNPRTDLAEQATGTWEEPPSANRVYLTDLTPQSAIHWPFATPPDRPLKAETIEQSILVRRKVSPHGIFMHPPVPPFQGEPSSIVYRLEKRFQLFTAKVGLNDGPAMSGSPITFRVYGDSELIWQSNPVRFTSDLQDVHLSVKDVDLLTIEVVCEGDARGCHAVWIEPSLSN